MNPMLWTPGQAFGAVTPHGVVVIEGAGAEQSAQVWKLLNEGSELDAVIRQLTQDLSSSANALPSFAAVVTHNDEVHVAARGTCSVHIDTAKGCVDVIASEDSRWEEKRVPRPSGWTIRTSASSQMNDGDQPPLPIINGMILVGSLSTSPVVGTAQAQQTVSQDAQAQQPASQHVDENQPQVAPSLPDHKQEPTHAPSQPSAAPTPAAPAPAVPAPTVPAPTPQVSAAHAPRPTAEQPFAPGEGPWVDDDMTDLFCEHTIAMHSIEAAVVRHLRNDANPFQHEEGAAPTGAQSDVQQANGQNNASLTNAAQPGLVQSAPTQPQVPSPQVPPVPSSPQVHPQSTPAQPTHAHPTPVPAVPAQPAPGQPAPARPTPGQPVPPQPGAGQNLSDQMPAPALIQVPPFTPADQSHHTVRSKDAPPQVRTGQPTPPAQAPAREPRGSMIFALLCPNGHANPTHITTCHLCGAALSTATTQVPQPSLGAVYFSTGEVFTLDRDIVVGRRPTYRPQPGRTDAHLVPVPSPNQEISRTHCVIVVDGWDVRVQDLRSNNGTFLLRPGHNPLRVTEGQPTVMRVGDVLDIGDGVTIRMEAS